MKVVDSETEVTSAAFVSKQMSKDVAGSAEQSGNDGFRELWGKPNAEINQVEWRRLCDLSQKLAATLPVIDRRERFGPLVGSDDLRVAPLHRWFSYKEGFSPALLGEVIQELQLPDEMQVADVFGGVATTALAGMDHPSVQEVRSLEYSPLAHFVGQTKIGWPKLDPDRLCRLVPIALDYDHQRPVEFPSLSSFRNPSIFPRSRLHSLLAARDHVRELDISEAELRFFLLGIVGVTEDLSGAMKDGRALRIKRSRSRRARSLADADPGFRVEGTVKRALAGQWSSMVQDLKEVAVRREQAELTAVHHLSGDARNLIDVKFDAGTAGFPEGWADLSVFSPPYLNCIDYTELYKLELWLMEHVVDQQGFRKTRLGTLRSHPSIQFPQTQYFGDRKGKVIELIEGLAKWMTDYSRRASTGTIVKQYFEDMFLVFQEQLRLLRPGAAAVCVVANSTFSRREKDKEGRWQEMWRLPILTDVILGHLALLAGFESVEILSARDLRPRNIKNGYARESLVVAKK